MRRLILLFFLVLLLGNTVCATEYTAPQPPEDALELMPARTESFVADLLQILRTAISNVLPELSRSVAVCGSILALVLLVSILKAAADKPKTIVETVATLSIAVMLLGATGSMVTLGAETVTKLSDYGKLLLPVMTGALAAQGGGTASAALYSITVVFDAVLSSAVGKILVPMVYVFLALSVAGCATGKDGLNKLADMMKGLMTWFLKLILYAFTGFMGVTGVVSGTADAAAVKAAKLTISGVVPVVGGILSDASESVIVGAGVVKNAVGVYGLLALIAVWISPFLQIGMPYLLLKATAGISEVFDVKCSTGLIQRFTVAMGLLLAMTGTVCFLLLISTFCFMKGGG